MEPNDKSPLIRKDRPAAPLESPVTYRPASFFLQTYPSSPFIGQDGCQKG